LNIHIDKRQQRNTKSFSQYGVGPWSTSSPVHNSYSNKIVKSGWGSRANFQASYGLKMTPDDIEEGKAILKAMEEADKERKNRGK
jgi:hypothetical protein